MKFIRHVLKHCKPSHIIRQPSVIVQNFDHDAHKYSCHLMGKIETLELQNKFIDNLYIHALLTMYPFFMMTNSINFDWHKT